MTQELDTKLMKTRYRFQQVGGVEEFYREAGPGDAPAILLLHGFPSASHMFRDLTPLLADRFRLIAPDLPGFGQTNASPRRTFDYTFDSLANVIKGFTNAMSLNQYASTSLTIVHRWRCVWRCVNPSECQPSFHKMATPTSKA